MAVAHPLEVSNAPMPYAFPVDGADSGEEQTMNAHRPAVERPLFQLRPITRAVVGLFLVGAPFSTHALPTGAAVSAGTAAISQSGSALTVQQATPRLAINWQSFGIGASESVVFKQPEAGSIALNRILGQDPSVILGSLSANGQVFILNPNGVLFGAGAQVDVGGIVASTLSLSDADFLASRYTFANTGSAGSVVNKGTIRAAEGGYVALVGPQVVNEGVIAARLGTVALGAGDQVTLQLAGSSLVGFSVDKAAVDALAANRQLIQADGGTVILSAQARDALLSTVVNNDGIVEARSVSTKNGVIRLEGGASGVVSVSGRRSMRRASAPARPAAPSRSRATRSVSSTAPLSMRPATPAAVLFTSEAVVRGSDRCRTAKRCSSATTRRSAPTPRKRVAVEPSSRMRTILHASTDRFRRAAAQPGATAASSKLPASASSTSRARPTPRHRSAKVASG